MTAAITSDLPSANPDETLQIANGSELLLGANEESLVFVGERKTYVRVSSLGAAIVRIISERESITRTQLMVELRQGGTTSSNVSDAAIDAFLERLRSVGALASDASPVRSETETRVLFRPKTRLPLRVVLFRPKAVLGRRLFILIRKQQRPIRSGLISIVILLCGFGVAQTFRTLGHASGQPWWIAVAAGVLLHGSLHEACHALTASWFGVRIRAAGVALLYWFIPVLYVDRTDSYRISARRSRAAIALAGPVFDAIGCGITGLLSNAGGTAGATFSALSLCQGMILLSNINPLFPTDGYHALEAASGELNVRGRALRLIASALRLRELPAELKNLPRTTSLVYVAYAIAAFLYVVVCLYMLGLLLPRLTTLVAEYAR